MSNVNLNETAPTQFEDIGGVSLAYRRFGKEGAPPVVCFQHFTGTMNNFDPIHTNRSRRQCPLLCSATAVPRTRQVLDRERQSVQRAGSGGRHG